ncbi:cupin domain-containing protein [Alphaproteobacteria bacterium]|nr:cupin domain-containing protein [Alphaproteobacteria bacterium]
MVKLHKMNFGDSTDIRTPEKTKMEVVDLGHGQFASKIELQPGWKWSECIKPIAGTHMCEKKHLGVVLSGRMHVLHEDGTSMEVGPGDAYTIAKQHDAWIIGEETYVAYEFDSDAAQTLATNK